MTKRSFISAIIFVLILLASGLIVFFSRGYRINLQSKSLKSTGLLVATSFPDGASVFIDGKLTTATNNTINLNPGFYQVKISKEGYIPWEKKLKIQGEIVTKTDAQLFPGNPELRPLTSLGVIDPTLSPDGTKIVFFVSNNDNSTPLSKDGIWILNITDHTLPINPQLVQIAKSTLALDWSTAKLYWSPDSKEIIAAFYSKETLTKVYLLSADQLNQTPQVITATLETLLNSWQEEKQLKEKRIIESLPLGFQEIASTSAKKIALSPDETKVLYTASKDTEIPQIITPPLLGTNSQEETRKLKVGNTYVYDIKEDKNFEVFKNPPQPSQKPIKPTPTAKNKIAPSPTPNIEEKLRDITNDKPSSFWLASSRHLVFIENSTIYVIEYDGTNKQALYGGPFEDSYLFPHADGSKLIILTNYNKSRGTTPNLYAINLK